MIISHEDRAAYRATLKNLDSLIETSTAVLGGRVPMTPDLQRVLYMLTKTSEHADQLRAITEMREMTANDYKDALLYAAREDLSAFHEYCNPSEPPARVHVVLCETIHKVVRGEAPRLMVNMPPGHAKPLALDTEVLMHDGTVRLLKDVEVGDFVITHEGRAREVIEVHEQGIQPALRIVTESGREIIAAPDHGFLTPRGFVEARALKAGTRLGFPRAITIRDTSGRSIDEFALAGYLQAFAFVSRKCFSRQHTVAGRFNAPNAAIQADVEAICTRLGFTVSTVRRVQYGSMVPTMGFGPEAVRWMDDAGLTDATGRDDLAIPSWVFRGDRDRIGAYLGAILACDPSFGMRRNEHTGSVKRWQTRCATLTQAQDLQMLMFRLGVNAEARSRFTSNFNYQPKVYASLHLNRAPDMHRLIRSLRLPSGVDPAILTSDQIGFDGAPFVEDRVERVEEVAPRAMRCLTVLEDHTFLASGLVVHNSTYCSVDFPAWWLGHNPRRRYLQAGHTQSFCEKQFGRRVKLLVASQAYGEVFPDTNVDPDAANGYWVTNTNAEYATLGVGQGISGFRAHLASVDDPYANVEDAENQRVRDVVWDWLTTDFLLRLMPDCPLFIISTRWHIDDVCGRYLRLQSEKKVEYPFEQVILDAICEDPDFDPLNRMLGEPLWEEVFNRKFIADKQNTLTAARFNSLYQQRPIPEEGNLLKQENINYFDVCPGDKDQTGQVIVPVRRVVVSVDTADKETKRSDYTTIGVWVEDLKRNYYLKYVKRARLKFDDLVTTITSIANAHHAHVVLIEDKGAGTQIISHYRTNADRAPVAPVIAVQPGTRSKTFRFDACLPLFAAGRVHVARRGDWVATYVTELIEFPDGKHDDQVDMTSQALAYMARTTVRRGTQKLGSRRESREEAEARIAAEVTRAQASRSGMIAG